MSTILLTGANSFVGSHIIDALIKLNHKVVGTVRSAAAANDILSFHPEWKDSLEVVVVEDITNGDAWDELADTLKQVVHVAAPLLDNPGNTDYDQHFLTPSVEGNLALLRSAQANAPALKSIVVTGSINACTTGSPKEVSAGPITNSTWLPVTKEAAREAQNAYISYCSGKKEGELAIWDFVKTNSPKFSVTVFLPALIFGPPIEPVKQGAKGLHYSARIIYSFFNGTYTTIPPTTFPSYVDVRDLAEAHVKALTEPKVANKRLTIGGQSMTYTKLVHSLAKVPELKGRLPADSGEDENVVPATVIADEATEALNLTFRSIDETMADTAKRILELEKQN
ncbi:uncharacterized protein TRIVIDRAFT_52826 [Trichoderma virens Gv29-8]|uniref:NAD-dependent epimerase/dehydratase domain-containing protein n=1 Tax=Hypocrea virens (strain Gv29-8 / FGSC 10586) TaxID=413071 RepID=G9MVC3_HYPVG|nr:uncharacterized protein TRIVIDRAFT_52826 [Trichoderma virens Gv29-8]EHK21639.1 hypothetical protein TRIVIDRAFT_52826 [Trichoderma virens Gv29-8]UKZ51080.1 hypothetical protein TrVGV298_004835 [Trichoderma virens]